MGIPLHKPDYNGMGGPAPMWGATSMNIDLVINARGRICLLHDQPFESTPLWVRYWQERHEIDILFDNSTSKTLESKVSDLAHQYFLNSERVLVVRLEDGKPVEGYETLLLCEP
jgi:hypothetical protein